MQEEISKDWRAEVQSASRPTLKLKDGDQVAVQFLDEGGKRTHPDFGTSVVFHVKTNGEEKNLYVKETNYDFLRQINSLGALTGKMFVISRTGSKKSDTRYKIIKP